MRSLLSVVDAASAKSPRNVWAYLPKSGDELTWRPMTWLQLKIAVDEMARWMELKLGPAKDEETVAYMAINDVRYPIAILASMKTGYKILLTSPRNSIAGHSSLLSSTGCRKLLYSPELQNQVDELIASREALVAIQAPELSELLHGKSETISFTKSSHELREDDTIMILHSSGTTGLPKPIQIKAGALAVIDTIQEMSAPPGRRNVHDELYSSTLMISMLPFFHIMGIATLIRSIYHRGPLALLPAGRPVTADLMVDAITRTKPSAIACAPSILEDMSNTPHGIEALSKVDHVFYGGAPLARSSGDRISAITTLLNGIGSTEILNVPSYIPQDPADWEYFEWNPEYGAMMEDRQNGSFELVVKQKFSREHQLIFYNFPDVSEWPTKDLFEQHPTKPGLWRYTGRIDDMMILSNGEKINPVLFEKAVEGHKLVRGALLVGSQRFQTVLIVEPHTDQSTPISETFIDRLWPTIEAANADLPSYARVWRSMVTLSRPDKPFQRAPKGSIMRNATCQLYEEEINRLYDTKRVTPVISLNVHSSIDVESIRDGVRKAVHSALQLYLPDDANFFLNGMDSLKILYLNRLLQTESGKGLPQDIQLSPAVIYKNHSINRLANSIFRATFGGDMIVETDPSDAISREEQMSAMIYKYTKSLPRTSAINRTASTIPPAGHVVILTGSTGSLGTYLLHYLLSNPQVSKVYCLNRSTDALSRQKHTFQDRGLDLSTLHDKAEFLTVDLTKDHFNLPPAQYKTLQQNITLLIHNAWPVKFNNELDYFESAAIAGTRRLVDFALFATYRPHFVLVSSIASVGNFSAVRPDEPAVPEEFDEDNSLPLAQGYGESKHVAGCILARAARLSGLRGAVVRVGQLSGPSGSVGRWNEAEWLPSLVLTSRNLGKIPSSLGNHDTLDWVPVDKAAEILLELTLPESNRDPGSDEGLGCFNLVNPRMGHWGDMLRAIQSYYAARGHAIMTADFSEWIGELEKIDVTDDAVARCPAIKLIDFYKKMSTSGVTGKRFATRRGAEHSRVLADLKAVDERLMEWWLAGWDSPPVPVLPFMRESLLISSP